MFLNPGSITYFLVLFSFEIALHGTGGIPIYPPKGITWYRWYTHIPPKGITWYLWYTRIPPQRHYMVPLVVFYYTCEEEGTSLRKVRKVRKDVQAVPGTLCYPHFSGNLLWIPLCQVTHVQAPLVEFFLAHSCDGVPVLSGVFRLVFSESVTLLFRPL